MIFRGTRTPRKRRRDTPPLRTVLVRGLVVWGLVASSIAFGVLVINGVPGRQYRKLTVAIPLIGNIQSHDPVRIGGAHVGQVLKRSVSARGEGQLELQLEPGLELSKDTRVRLRANGLLGARFVELIPGRNSEMLADGDVIRAPANALTYGVSDALDTFDAETRGAFTPLVTELGSGMLTNGVRLNEAIDLGAEAIGPFQRIVEGIFARPGALERLVPSLAATTTVFDVNRRELASLPRAISRGFGPLADERRAIQDTLDMAPRTLTATRAGLTDGEALLDSVDRLALALNRTLPRAPRALRDTTELLRDSQRPLVTARSLLNQIPPSVPATLGVTKRLSPLLPHAGRTLRPLPGMLTEVARHGCEVKNLAVVFRSMTGFGGQGQGPNGPPGEFRLLPVIPAGGEAVGIGGASAAPLRRDGYSPLCKHVNVPYDIIPGPAQLPPKRDVSRKAAR